jgi:type IV secretion system protein VirD4
LILNAVFARWPRPASPQLAFGVLKGAAFLVAGVLASQYLAGLLFLASLHMNPKAAGPLTIARYAFAYRNYAVVTRRLWLCSAVGTAAIAVFALWAAWPRPRPLHGEARFARRREIARARLLGAEGIILGRRRGRYVMLPGQQGVALAAPPRSGKGVGIVVPNALNWPGSLVCVDIKRENWALTAGYRAQCGQKCYLFDPFAEDRKTARWNPFSYVSEDPGRRLNDLQRIGEMLYPDPPNVDPFWTASARSLFLGIALFLFESPPLPRTIGEVLRQGMASDNEGFGQHWKRLITGRNSGSRPLSPECVRALYDVIDLAPVTASSIRKTFTSRLDLWLNPILDAATSESDFDLRKLRTEPLSVYVGVNPDDLHRLRPVLSLFFQQAIGLQTRELPERNPALKHQVMMLLDEFTALGRIPILSEAISYLPGYNVRVVLVIQTPAQLREVYGIHNTEVMLKSLAARIVFAPKDVVDAREISDELGFTTVRARSVSQPMKAIFDSKGRNGRSQTVSLQRRALMLPQEIKELGTHESIVFYEGLHPIRCRKLRYYEDRRFKARLLPPPAHPTPMHAREDGAPSTEGAAPPPESAVPKLSPRSQESSVTYRDATAADIQNLDALGPEDFECNPLATPFPVPEGPLSEPQLQGLVRIFFESVQSADR